MSHTFTYPSQLWFARQLTVEVGKVIKDIGEFLFNNKLRQCLDCCNNCTNEEENDWKSHTLNHCKKWIAKISIILSSFITLYHTRWAKALSIFSCKVFGAMSWSMRPIDSSMLMETRCCGSYAADQTAGRNPSLTDILAMDSCNMHYTPQGTYGFTHIRRTMHK